MGWLRRLLPWLFGLLLLIVPADICHAKTVTLSWDASPTSTVTGYRAFVSLNSDMSSTLLSHDAGNVLTLTITDLADTSEHWFCVKAYDAEGTESVCSKIVNSPPVGDVPGKIQNFRFEIK